LRVFQYGNPLEIRKTDRTAEGSKALRGGVRLPGAHGADVLRSAAQGLCGLVVYWRYVVTEVEDILHRLVRLYQRMDEAYADAAGAASLSCTGCDGVQCCTVDLTVHTFAEMALLQEGFQSLPFDLRCEIKDRARRVVCSRDRSHASDEYRNAVCVANFDGACILYDYRPRICRLAGVPYQAVRPDGTVIRGPGCTRFKDAIAKAHPELLIDRSDFYRGMADIEIDAVRARRAKTSPRTMAEIFRVFAL